MLQEIIPQQLYAVNVADAFVWGCGRQRPVQCAQQVHANVCDLFQLDPARAGVLTSPSARLCSFGLASISDVVLVRRGEHFGVAQLWLFVGVFEDAIALVSFWRLQAYDQADGVAMWHAG